MIVYVMSLQLLLHFANRKEWKHFHSQQKRSVKFVSSFKKWIVMIILILLVLFTCLIIISYFIYHLLNIISDLRINNLSILVIYIVWRGISLHMSCDSWCITVSWLQEKHFIINRKAVLHDSTSCAMCWMTKNGRKGVHAWFFNIDLLKHIYHSFKNIYIFV